MTLENCDDDDNFKKEFEKAVEEKLLVVIGCTFGVPSIVVALSRFAADKIGNDRDNTGPK